VPSLVGIEIQRSSVDDHAHITRETVGAAPIAPASVSRTVSDPETSSALHRATCAIAAHLAIHAVGVDVAHHRAHRRRWTAAPGHRRPIHGGGRQACANASVRRRRPRGRPPPREVVAAACIRARIISALFSCEANCKPIMPSLRVAASV
jgi:hypothetical protein